MAKYYGTLTGYSKNVKETTEVTRCGRIGIRASAQTYDGSVIAVAYDDEQGNTMFSIESTDKSANFGKTLFDGTLEELEEALLSWDYEKSLEE